MACLWHVRSCPRGLPEQLSTFTWQLVHRVAHVLPVALEAGVLDPRDSEVRVMEPPTYRTT